jgi:molybdopterin molybdotransferase
MLTVDEALSKVMEHARPLPPAELSLLDSCDRLLAENIAADADQPPFDKSLVDGYAVRVTDLQTGNARLKIGESILAGQIPVRGLGPCEAAVIMTGAPLPAEADAVVMRERTRILDETLIVDDAAAVRAGQNILRRGDVYRRQDLVLQSGAQLDPASLGLLASVGRTRVKVIPKPSVAILPTGDELVEPSDVPGPGQIRNSNAVMLEGSALGHAAPRVFPIARDELRELHRIVQDCLKFDVLLVTGGVSAGQRDLVPSALEESGVRPVFHKVRIKPGKPLWFGIGPPRGKQAGTLVFGLPGNPASSLVGFLVFVEPAIHVLAGRMSSLRVEVSARLAFEFVHRGDNTTYRPARRLKQPSTSESLETGMVEILDWAGSADLLNLARADGFAILEPGDRVFQAGEIVRFLPLR